MVQPIQTPNTASLKQYCMVIPKRDFALLTLLARKCKRKKILFINTTSQGGGVSKMRKPLIALYRLLRVNASWYVLEPKSDAFEITKRKFHNVLQGISDKELTLEDEKTYNDWISKNALILKSAIQKADVIVIDDPQPAGLIPYIKIYNKAAKIIFRFHIHMESSLINKESSPQRKTWLFLWKQIQDADCFVFHPIEKFVPKNIPKEKVVFMPATIDPFDGINKKLSQIRQLYYMRLLNQLLIKQEGQIPLNLQRPYIVQVARFDPAKGIPDVIESYLLLRKLLDKKNKPIPQLVICGESSIDDPEHKPMYDKTIALLYSNRYNGLADDIKVVRLPHEDELINSILQNAKISLQLSTKEGFEVNVTESILKGVPIVAYQTGGIILQIQNNVTGFLVKTGDIKTVAKRLYTLCTDSVLYKKMSNAGSTDVKDDFFTASNAICWLYLAFELMENGKINGNHAWVRELARKSYSLSSPKGQALQKDSKDVAAETSPTPCLDC